MQAYYNATGLTDQLESVPAPVVLDRDEFVTCLKAAENDFYECDVLDNRLRKTRTLGAFDEVRITGLKVSRTPEIGMINIFPYHHDTITCNFAVEDGKSVLSCMST